ncbi:MAG: hypothetical protein DHS20C01_26220 [marine bacterium B5-7]|nr:MAG: hypothetical protein DHS20C01_26220 [marine bacterium B5-7]
MQLILLLMAALVAMPVMSQDNEPIWQADLLHIPASSMQGYPGTCYFEPLWGNNMFELAELWLPSYLAVTGTQCFKRCRNPERIDYSRLGEDTNGFWHQSLCTGNYYFRSVERIKNPKHCNSELANASGGTLYGNPCNAATGAKIQVETDIQLSGHTSLGITRTYSSQFNDHAQYFGWNWSSSLSQTILRYGETINEGTIAVLRTGGGRAFPMIRENGAWRFDADVTLTVTETTDGLLINHRDGSTDLYEPLESTTTHYLTEHTDARGLKALYRYNDQRQVIDVTGPYGHSLSITYTGSNISTITDPQGGVYTYGYEADLLTSVTYPDGGVRVYHYEDDRFPHHLTGITDARDIRYATFSYDNEGRAISTRHAITDNDAAQEEFTFSYDSNTQTTVTDAAGTPRILTFADVQGVKKLTSAVNGIDGRELVKSYDTNGNVLSVRDEAGQVTSYTYNAHNQRITRTEADGTAEARTTYYTYLSPESNKVMLEQSDSVYAGFKKETVTTYDNQLNPISITVRGFDPAGNPVSRTTGYQYDTEGRLTAVDGSRTDVNDVTTFSYYMCQSGNECGQLASRHNAAGHTTTFDAYDANGRLLQETDPTGVVTTYAYHPRGWLLSRTRTSLTGSPRTTNYTYDAAGQLIQVVLDDGMTLTYQYDAAGDLRVIEDPLGNRVEYHYDLKGNRTQQVSKDPDGTLVHAIAMAYDIRNRLSTLTQGINDPSITHHIQDPVGKLTQETDPNQNQTTHQYDPLNRLTETIDALASQTTFGYDINDQLTEVNAPGGAKTHYHYDDLGNKLEESSSDRGITQYSYDQAGNMTSLVDARGIVVHSSYDALNRPTAMDYPGSDEDQNFVYDNCINGKGRLCVINDPSGETRFEYDEFGNLRSEVQIRQGVSYTTGYSYDDNDRVASISYPSGRVVTYHRDALGRITGIDTTQGDVTVNVLTHRSYNANHQFTSQTFGNGLTETRRYDTRARLISQQMGDHESRDYNYDANDNLLEIEAVHSPDYEYDALNRLIAELISDALTVYDYDANGNRLMRTRGTTTPDHLDDCDPEQGTCDTTCTPGAWCFEAGEKQLDYIYAEDSNQLIQIGKKSIELDPAGNTLSDRGGKRRFEYNSAGHLSHFYKNGALKAEYIYNARRQRTHKTITIDSDGNPIDRRFQYFHDQNGRLISEYRNGSPLREYLWADDVPVMRERVKHPEDVKENQNTVYITTDHLNTPRLGTNETNTIVWRWDSDAFGKGGLDKDPDDDGLKRNVRLRFPGQFADGESGLYYNWNRYYDPRTGRYITSDPIGLDGGLNTYGYVYQNPLRLVDPEGKQAEISDTIDKLGNRGEFFGDLICAGFNAMYIVRLKEAERKIKSYANSLAPCTKGCSLLCVKKTRHQNRVCTSDVFSIVGDCPLSFAVSRGPFSHFSCRKRSHTGGGQCCGSN